MAELQEGDKAPAFGLRDDRGEKVRLSDFSGQPVVLFFYPEADTPGCTAQACSLRDEVSGFEELDAVVLGVSPDPPEANARFRAKYRLPFSLLSDEDHAVATKYGAWGKRQLYGQEFVGMTRSSFVIGPDGRIRSIHRNVRTEGHGRRMLDALREKLL